MADDDQRNVHPLVGSSPGSIDALSILESINDAFFTVDDDWRFTYLNSRAEELWGRRRGDLLGKNIWEEFPSAVGTEAHRAVVQAAQTGENVGYETFSPTVYAWISGRAYPSPHGVSVYFRDVTEITEARKALEDRERRYRTLTSNIPGAVFRCVHHDGDPTMEFVSGRIEEITGYPAGDFISDSVRSYVDVIHPEDRKKNARTVWRALERRGTYNIEYRIAHGDGGVRWANERGTGIFSDNDELLWIDGAIFDITARKRAEEALRRSAGRTAFRVKLTEALRPLADPAEIRSEAARVLGEHLRVDRVLYADIDEEEERITVEDNYVTEGVCEIVGSFPAADFPQSSGTLRSGEPVVIEDVAANAELEESERRSLGALGVGSVAVVPLVKGGRWVSNLGVYHRTARAYSEAEVTLLSETAERTWAAVERARAEAALKESEEKYRTLFETVHQGFGIAEILVDDAGRPADYRMVEINPQFERLTGQSREEFLDGRTVREAAPELEEEWYRFYGSVGLTGEPAHREIHAEAWDRWFEVSAYRIGAPEQRRVAILFTEITERKRVDLALRESEERFRAVANLVPDLLWRNDGSGYTDWYNDRWLEYTGQSLEEATGYGWLDVIHPDDRERSRANFRRVLDKGEPLLQEHRIRAADGQYRWFLVRAEPPRDAGDKTLRWFGAATDVHEQRVALEALRENGEWLKLAQRAARSGTWEWDLRTDEIRWSDEHRDLFGFDPSEEPIKREDWWANVHPEDLPRIKEAGRRCLEEHEEWPEIEYRIFRAGEIRWIAARGRTERDGAGRAVRILGISVDATERKKAEEERDRLLAREWVASAEAAERGRISRELHDRVAHSMGVAHQSLQLHGVLADKDPTRAEAKLDLAREMTKASLESTRNLSAELRRLDAEDGLEAELGHLLDVAVPPDISASVRVSGDEHTVPGHVRGQLFLVLREAVRNAVSHSGCATISVGLDVAPERVVGTVEDDGRGFEATGGKAAGVGLRSMRERAAMLNGTLELACEPGWGTRVEVCVPLARGR